MQKLLMELLSWIKKTKKRVGVWKDPSPKVVNMLIDNRPPTKYPKGYRFKFGKYKGKQVSEVPKSYWEWFCKNVPIEKW